MIDNKDLESLLSDAAAEYSYRWGEKNFECTVKITCEQGWAKATIIEEL